MHEGKDKAERVKVFDKHFDTLKHLPEDYQVSLDLTPNIKNKWSLNKPIWK
jgi:uncharacterized protein YktB (UPF0637 family)